MLDGFGDSISSSSGKLSSYGVKCCRRLRRSFPPCRRRRQRRRSSSSSSISSTSSNNSSTSSISSSSSNSSSSSSSSSVVLKLLSCLCFTPSQPLRSPQATVLRHLYRVISQTKQIVAEIVEAKPATAKQQKHQRIFRI